MSRFLTVFFFCTLISSFSSGQTSASAKPDTSQEALVFDRFDTLVRFEDNGTGVRETTAVIRVQSQAGVQAMGQLIFGYASATENLEVNYVRVRKPDGRVIETPAAGAQDFAPDILREAPTYTDYRQRHISVAGLQAGDVLEYHIIVHVTVPMAPHEFWYEHSFDKDIAVHQERLLIDVPKSRTIKLKSPEHKYETQETGERRIYTWTKNEIVPDRKHESEEELTEPDFTPDVQMTSFSDWQQVAEWYAKLQGDRVVVDQNVRKKAEELARGASTPLEKTRRLYDYVSRNVRYVSLSFGVGRLQPHAASEVLQNGYGDCKDKHTLLQALLRAEGIESYPVLISSFRELDPDIASPAQFNHEITAVALGGDITWLDTTAEVASYGLIMYPLRNKQALLAAEGKTGGLRRTAANPAVRNQLLMKLDGHFTEAGAFDTTVDLTAHGDSDLPLRVAFRSIPEARWSDVLKNLSQMWGLAGDVSNIHLDPLEDTTKPFHLIYHYHKANYFSVPNSGVSFRILPPMGLRQLLAANRKEALQPLRVGPAVDEIYRARIQFPANYTVQLPPSAAISRDYGDYSISYSLNKNVLEAERRISLRVDELPASRRHDYESFQNVASNAVEQLLSARITPASAAALASAAKAEGTPEELQKAGTLAYNRRDFSAAVDLFKRALEGDSNLKNGWDQLGQAYASLNQHDDAVRAFRKQIELDAFHKTANEDLASELQQQGKFDDAVQAYRKQLEITPFDRSTHKNLGLLLAQLNKDSEAATELEAAAALPPEDPQVKVTLARVYERTGNTPKAEALMKSVAGVATTGTGSDIYAAALRDDIDPNQTLRDARTTLNDIGDQFDSGEYDRLGSSAFRAMDVVALAWARIGWAKFLQGENLDAMQFLHAAWLLSQSGTVENRLARVLEKEGQREKAAHAFAMAVAAGGGDVPASKERFLKLSQATDVDKAVEQALTELVQMRTVKMPAVARGAASAQFALLFDGSNKPERAEWLDGDISLRSVGDALREKEYSVKFPEMSSVKIVRKATLACDGSACSVVLAPLEGLQPMQQTGTAAVSH